MSLSVPIASAEHTSAALREGESREDLMEEIRVAAEMRGGAAYHKGSCIGRNGERRQQVSTVDESSARSHVPRMTCKVTFHLRLPPEGTDTAGF